MKKSSEYDAFSAALKKVLHVSKEDLKQLIADDEKKRRQVKQKPGPKPRASSASGRAFCGLDND
jgi:hypothetical protein